MYLNFASRVLTARFCLFCMVFLRLVFAAAAPTASASPSEQKKVRIGIVSFLNKSEFEEYRLKTFSVPQCPRCEVLNLSPYGEDGKVLRDGIADALKTVGDDWEILFFHFNAALDAQTEAWRDQLKRLADKGTAVVGVAGLAEESQPTLPLARTFLGAVPHVLILGQRNNRDLLPQRSFFGPPMLTALRVPPEEFILRLVKSWDQQGSPAEWVRHFENKKNSSKKPWLDLKDLF